MVTYYRHIQDSDFPFMQYIDKGEPNCHKRVILQIQYFTVVSSFPYGKNSQEVYICATYYINCNVLSEFLIIQVQLIPDHPDQDCMLSRRKVGKLGYIELQRIGLMK